jgi:hypothetical protein
VIPLIAACARRDQSKPYFFSIYIDHIDRIEYRQYSLVSLLGMVMAQLALTTVRRAWAFAERAALLMPVMVGVVFIE